MAHITRDSLLTLEAYARARTAMRAEVIEHKRLRKVEVGPAVTLHFEDELTIRYQIQEMLRAERIFEEQGIQDELDAYGPLVPDGRNFKATMMLEYPDPEERRQWLEKLIGIEDRAWLQVDGFDRVWAIADEDLDRETAEKTSSVHFLRFELTVPMATGLKAGASLGVGIDHDAYRYAIKLPPESRDALAKDLE
jgi:hypothetical protein